MAVESSDALSQLRSSQLLAGLDEDQREAFMTLASIVDIPDPGIAIVREGEASENFYWILEGEAEVSKLEPRTEREFSVSTLGPGDHFGETSLLRAGNRTATIRSRTPLRLVMVRARTVRDAPNEHAWLAPFLLGLVRVSAQRLGRLTDQTVQGLRDELDGSNRLVALSQLLIFAILGLALYGLGLATLGELVGPGMARGALRVILELGLLGAMVAAVETGPYSWKFFGLRAPIELRGAVIDGVLVTAAGVGVLSLLGFAVAQTGGGGAGAEAGLFRPSGDLFVGAVYLLGTVALVGLEELCVRGVLQSALVEVFRGNDRRLLYAIVLSNALFAAVHAPISANYALLQFGLGLIWGYVYSRQRSLVAVVIPHVLVAFFALRILRLDLLLGASG